MINTARDEAEKFSNGNPNSPVTQYVSLTPARRAG